MASIHSIIIRQRIANVLRLRRKQLHITQRGMDERCGKEKCWFSWRERGATDISAQELLLIAAALECTPHDIYIAAGLMKAPPKDEPQAEPPSLPDLQRVHL